MPSTPSTISSMFFRRASVAEAPRWKPSNFLRTETGSVWDFTAGSTKISRRGVLAHLLRSAAARGGLSVIFSAVPRLVKRHVIARLNLYPPVVLGIFVVGRTRDQSEGHAEALDLERLNLDPPIRD